MTGLAPYIAAGFAAALAASPFELSLAGLNGDLGSRGSQSAFWSVSLPRVPAAISFKGDRLKSPPAGEQAQMVSTVELGGFSDATVVMFRDATGQVLYRSDPTSDVTMVSKGVMLPQITIREIDHASPAEPAESVRWRALPEGCDPAVSSIGTDAASDFGVRCLTAREVDVRVASLY